MSLWSHTRLFHALVLGSTLSLQACTVLPLGSTTAPAPVAESSSWGTWESGTLRLGIRVPSLRTSALEDEDRRVSVFVVRDTALLQRYGTWTSKGKVDLEFDDLPEGESEIIVKVYDSFGSLVGQGYTAAMIRSGRVRSASVFVLPASDDDDDFPQWGDSSNFAPPDFEPTPDPWLPVPADPNQFFISQMYDAKWNPGAPNWTQNCGPASLAMVLRAYNILPPLLSGFGDPQALIHKTRRAMMGTEDDFQLTSLEDLERGASACGIFHDRTYGLSGVREALQSGRLVILAGNPTAYNHRFSSNQYSSFDGGHFVLVTKMTATQAFLNDPLSRTGSLAVSLTELERYMAYKSWNVGLGVYR